MSMLEALKRFHNAEQMLDEQENLSSYSASRIINIRSQINKVGTDFSESNIKLINDLVEELIIESGVMSDQNNTTSLSPHSLKSFKFQHSNLVAEEFGKMPGWFKKEFYLFEFTDGWKIGVGAPARLIKDLTLETIYDLNQYCRKVSGKDLLSRTT